MSLVARKTLLITIFLFVAGFCLSARGQRCLEYGPTVSLGGTLRSQTFPGPPNYKSIKRGDLKERAIILTLNSRICSTGNAENSFDVPETNISEVQMVVTESSHWKIVEGRLGKRVVVSGALFHGHTGHHRTKVLIMVSGIRRP